MAQDQGPRAEASACPIPGARIASIRIERAEIFDGAATGAGGWIARAGNAVHVRTWERRVRAYLLFREGDACADEALAQTERNLRSTGLFQQVQVSAAARQDGSVDVAVSVRDTWTLRIDGDFGHVGGVDTWAIRFADISLLGSGIGVGVKREKLFDASVTSGWYNDPRFLGSREHLSVRAERRSDGRATAMALVRPFDSLDTRWGHEIGYAETLDHLRLYQDGDLTGEFDRKMVDAVAGLAARVAAPTPSSVWRLAGGVRFIAREHALLDGGSAADDVPPTTRWAGPYVNLHFVDHRFIERVGVYVPGREADFNLGTEFTASTFVSGRLAGLDTTPRLTLGAALSRGWRLPADGVLLASASASGQWGGPEPSRGEAVGLATLFWQPTPTRVRSLRFVARTFVNPDSGSRLYLGGDPGLRGYRQYAFAGTRTLLVEAEERKFFDWTLWSLLQFGVAGFVEAGVVGGVPDLPGTTYAAANAGAGLRIAELWTAGTVLRMDVALPLVAGPDGRRQALLVVQFQRNY